MQEIQKFDQSQNLPVKVKEIYEAVQTDLVSQSTNERLYDVVKGAVIKSYFDLGIARPEDADFMLMSDSILKDIRTYAPNMRLGEIPVCFAKGLRKEYGDYFGLNVITFNMFVQRYAMHNDRLNALKALHTPPEEKYIPLQAEVFEMSKKNAVKSYDNYKLGIQIALPTVIYDFLDGLGIVNISLDKKRELFDRAKIMVVSEAKSAVHGAPDSILKSIAKSKLEEIESGREQDLVKIRAKHAALDFFFECCSEVDLDLESEIGEFKG